MPEESISVSQYFECLDCKSNVLVEILSDVTLSSPLEYIHTEEEAIDVGGAYPYEIEYGDVSWDGGVVARYQCANCGWAVQDINNRNITDPEELLRWLIQHREDREKK